MTSLLLRWFVKETDKESIEYREKIGFLGGWVGLISNLLLFVIKFLSGIFTGSISIATDAINNLSDGSSSLITIVGVKLSAIPADEEHPYGHARFEHISGLLVSCLIFVIGIQFFINSVKRILTPETTEFNWIIGALLVFSIIVKLWQGLFYKKLGKEIDSGVLLAMAVDSRNDVLITLVVLISSVVQSVTGWLLDGPMGLVVSILVIYSGIELLRDTLSPLIGAAPDRALVKLILEKIATYPSVFGTHDLMIHNYGYGCIFASVHVEVPAEQDIMISHDIIDNMERDFLLLHDIHLVVHMDPIITDDPEINMWFERVQSIVETMDPALSIHDFRMVKGITHSNLIFDMTVPPRHKLKNATIRKRVQDAVTVLDDNLYVVITIDRSYISSIK